MGVFLVCLRLSLSATFYSWVHEVLLGLGLLRSALIRYVVPLGAYIYTYLYTYISQQGRGGQQRVFVSFRFRFFSCLDSTSALSIQRIVPHRMCSAVSGQAPIISLLIFVNTKFSN